MLATLVHLSLHVTEMDRIGWVLVLVNCFECFSRKDGFPADNGNLIWTW